MTTLTTARVIGFFSLPHASLAAQLSRGPLSSRQAEYVAKATSSTGRRNKRNADAFDAVFERCIA